MRRWLLFLLSVVFLLAAPAYGGSIINNSILFSETLNGSLIHITDVVHSADRGIIPGTPFDVDKFIENGSGKTLENYQIVLQICEGLTAGCAASGPTDSISFVAGDFTVDKNSVLMDSSMWSVSQSTAPFEKLVFRLGFPLEPDDVLSIHFKMVDTNPTGGYWALLQTANVPEPNTFLLFCAGCLLCLVRKLTQG